MARESVQLVAPDGRAASAEAVVLRPSAASRAFKATLFVVAGLVGGLISIAIPVVHLVAPWALPLLAIYFAIRVMKRPLMVDRIEGVCPVCHQPVMEFDRGGDDPSVEICRGCDSLLNVRLSEGLTGEPG